MRFLPYGNKSTPSRRPNRALTSEVTSKGNKGGDSRQIRQRQIRRIILIFKRVLAFSLPPSPSSVCLLTLNGFIQVVDQTLKSASPTISSADDFESLIAQMLLEQYLKEDFHFTAYSTISYLIPGPRANWLRRGGSGSGANNNNNKFFINLKTKSKKSAASHSAIVPAAVEKAKETLAPAPSSAGTKNHVKIKKTGQEKRSSGVSKKGVSNGVSNGANSKAPKAPEIEESNFVLLDSDSD